MRGFAGIDLHGNFVQAWVVPFGVLACVLLPYAVGPLLIGYASGIRVRTRGAGLLTSAVEQLRHRADHGDALGRLPAPSKGLLHPRAWDFVFSQIRISLSTSALACTRGGGSLDTRSGLIVRVEDCEHVEIVYAYPVDDEEVAA